MIRNKENHEILSLSLMCLTFALSILIIQFFGNPPNTSIIIFAWTCGGTIIVIFSFIIFKRNMIKLEDSQETFVFVKRMINPETKRIVGKANSVPFDFAIRDNFRRAINRWDRANTVAHSHAFELLRIVYSEYVPQDIVKPIWQTLFQDKNVIDVVARSFDKEDRKGWYDDVRDPRPTLEASYAAIKIAMSYLRADNREPNLDNIKSVLNKNESLEIFKNSFLLKCYDPNSGGFMDTDEGDAPTVASTGLAIRICSILFEQKPYSPQLFYKMISEFFHFEKDANPIVFIESCLKSIEEDGNILMGFSDRPDDDTPAVCSTFFSISFLEQMEGLSRIDKYKDSILLFVEGCLKKSTDNSTKGFSAQKNDIDGDLMHTYYALRLIEKLFPNYLDKQNKSYYTQLHNFLISCKSGNGFAFKKDSAPNVFSTCMAYHTNKIIEKHLRSQDIVIDYLDTIKFIASCYDPDRSAFAGFPFEIEKRNNKNSKAA